LISRPDQQAVAIEALVEFLDDLDRRR